MGEMLGNIAHQWRQPLTHLSYTIMNIEDAFKHKVLEESYLTKKVTEANTQIEFMSQTIDDFKEFYAIHKAKEYFSLVHELKQLLEIMRLSFKEKDITIELNIIEDLEVYNYKNEYKQVLLNLFTNAKDVLVQRAVEEPKVIITINKKLTRFSITHGSAAPCNPYSRIEIIVKGILNRTVIVTSLAIKPLSPCARLR